MSLITKAKNLLEKSFSKVVIWGFKSEKYNSFKYIYNSYNKTLLKLGITCLWVDDDIKNNKLINNGDLVFTSGISSKNLEYKPKVYYCTHNVENDDNLQIDTGKHLKLQVYTDLAKNAETKIDSARYFDKKTRTLYQPWGADLMPSEFFEPIFNNISKEVYWVDNIWNNERNQGNTEEIYTFKKLLKTKGLSFLHPEYVTDTENVKYVRSSRFAPSIAGNWQVNNNYLPCRMFKNISYGQLGITNVLHFSEIFNGSGVFNKSIDELIEESLAIDENKWLQLTRYQQDIVANNYTYVHSLINISQCFQALD